MRAICVTNTVDNEELFYDIVFLKDDESPEGVIDRMVKSGDHRAGVYKEDINYFYIDLRAAKKLQTAQKVIERFTVSDEIGEWYAGVLIRDVCKAFQVHYPTVEEVLRSLELDTIDEALGKGWIPPPLGEIVSMTLGSIERKDLAEAYSDEVMGNLDDVRASVEFACGGFVFEAEGYLESLKPKPKAPRNMTDDELINEATQMNESIHEPFSTDEVLRLNALETELVGRGYEVRIGKEYSITKEEEE